MTALPPKDLRRVVASAALMSSDIDGEALAATRAICRQLGKHGLSPASVVEAGLLRDERAAHERPVFFRDPATFRTPPLKPHQRTAYMARGFAELLNEWELSFLESMIGRREITPRQQDALNGIASKIERGRK